MTTTTGLPVLPEGFIWNVSAQYGENALTVEHYTMSIISDTDFERAINRQIILDPVAEAQMEKIEKETQEAYDAWQNAPRGWLRKTKEYKLALRDAYEEAKIRLYIYNPSLRYAKKLSVEVLQYNAELLMRTAETRINYFKERQELEKENAIRAIQSEHFLGNYPPLTLGGNN